MRRVRLHRTIDAPAGRLWELLVTVDDWSRWGPTVRGASTDGPRIGPGSTGTVRTVVGLELPFAVTDYVEGARWAWEVAGVPATDHTVEALGPDRCRVGFGVPWPVTPYLAVCGLALRRLDRIARRRE